MILDLRIALLGELLVALLLWAEGLHSFALRLVNLMIDYPAH